jgi:anti-sigma regulatory factor (Ser/Thr protein kinase)
MKLQNNSLGTLSQGFESKDVSVVSVNADALEIVSQMFQNDIYSNKLEAAIRETAANAIDEHIKYNIDRDVEIKLEHVKNETWLSVRDFAKGLDEKDLREVFGGLFCSTKTLTNSATGGFGIGAKSPICYAENFIVTSFFDNKKTSFVFYRDKGSTGSSITKIAKFNEEKTNEPSGIEVRIPIQYSDVEKANKIATRFVEDLSEESRVVYIDNFQSRIRPLEEKVWTIGNFKICQKDTKFNYSPLIRMGSIIYKLPDSFSVNCDLFNSLRTIIEVPIGTFSMPPSRETLSDTPENIKKWNHTYSQIRDFYDRTKQLVKLSYEDLVKKYLQSECFQFKIKEDFKVPNFFLKGEFSDEKKKVVVFFEKDKHAHWSRKKIDYFAENNPESCLIYAYVKKDDFKENINKIKSIDDSIECITEKDKKFRVPRERNHLKQEFFFFKKETEYSRPYGQKYSVEKFVELNPIPENFDIKKVSNIKDLKNVCVEMTENNSRFPQSNLNYCCKTAFKALVEIGYYNWKDKEVQDLYLKLLERQNDLEKKRSETNQICSHLIISNRSKTILNKLIDDSFNLEKINRANYYSNKLRKGLKKISEKSKLHEKLIDNSRNLSYNGFNRKEIKHLIKNI